LKSHHGFFALLLVVCILSGLSSPASALKVDSTEIWTSQPIGVASTDSETPLQIDSTGKAHVAFIGWPPGYASSQPAGLNYAVLQNGEWVYETIEIGGEIGPSFDMALDKGGYPYIVYSIRTNEGQVDVRCASKSSGNLLPWNTVAYNVGKADHINVRMDYLGNPAVSFLDQTGTVKIYKYSSLKGWGLPKNFSGPQISPSLGIDSSDILSLAYLEADRDLIYAIEGSPWTIDPVEAAGKVPGNSVVLAFDKSYIPHIAYEGAPSGGSGFTLHLASKHDGTWTDDEIDPVSRIEGGIALVLDEQDRAHLTYKDVTQNSLWYAAEIGTGEWDISKVGSFAAGGHAASLALDLQQKPHIFTWDRSQVDSTQTVNYLSLATRTPTPTPTPTSISPPSSSPQIFLPLVLH